MKKILLNAIIFAVCVTIGGFLNGIIIKYSGSIISPPEGSDLTTEKGLMEAMARMEPKHFILPFLAHALGSFLSAFLVSVFIRDRKIFRALLAGFLFFLGGLSMVFKFPSPLWFDAVDLGLAYIPMAWLGYKLAQRFSK